MSTSIIASPLGRQLEDTGEVINLEVFVRDEDFVGTYDRLEVHRSVSGKSGPYVELTSDVWERAIVPDTAGGPPSIPVSGASVSLVGLDLELLVNETIEVVILFTGSNPLTYASAAGQVGLQGLNLIDAYVDALGVFVVRTTGVGVVNSLRVVGGTAASLLRLSVEKPGNFGMGRNVRFALLEGVSRYTFNDPFSAEDYHYRTRFRNSSSNAVSEFSQSFTVGARVGVLPSELAIGDIDLVSLDGTPVINQQVNVHTKYTGTVTAGGKMVAGGDVGRSTDENGHVEFALVRGQKVTVSIPGTSLFRAITVPVDPDVVRFALWDPSVGDDADLFKVVVPKIIVAERRSL